MYSAVYSTIFAAGLAALFCLTPAVRAQGPLTPPGAPEPTMKTLAQIEPRVAITNVPFTITQPGSYYLTTNFAAAGSGVIVQANRVTVDLMGFSLTGDNDEIGYGVWVSGQPGAPWRDVTVRGGSIAGFSSGVYFEYAENGVVEGVAISDNVNHGVILYGAYGGPCSGNSVVGCAISGNGYTGVSMNGSQSGGRCNANTISRCVIRGNGASGISLNGGAEGRCWGNTIVDSTVSDNQNDGIMLNGLSGRCDGNRISRCSISGNAVAGVRLSGSQGQVCGNWLENNLFCDNADSGVRLEAVSANRVQSNHIAGPTGANNYGIISYQTSSANLVVQNMCFGYQYNYSLSTNDVNGPVVYAPNGLSTNGAAMSPWANFYR